jgi:hypothetical protein
MPKANEKEKSFTILEKDLNVISVLNNPKLSPFLDIFRHYPENISLQNLGILTGFFRIKDFQEESAYIVNFLSSVLKKEYYANSKKSIESSFDCALRKVNLALSEIAKEGNINWIGEIDGIVCVLEKNNLHFSVCGKAKVFLFRNQQLSEISADMASEEIEPNPLKTFVNVSSGRLEKGDKLIICDDDIFKVFSQEEIKKGANRFPREKFIQFIKTALTNKLDIVGAIVVDIFEKKEEKKIAQEDHSEVYNVFSKKVFEEKKPAPRGLNEILRQEENNNYTDEKTGHIYIQEGNEEIKKESNFNLFWLSFKENLGDAFYWIKDKTRKRMSLVGRSIAKANRDLATNAKLKLEERRKIRLEKKEEAEKLAAASAAAKAMADKKAIADEKALADEKERAALASANATIVKKEEIAIPAFNEPFLARLAKRKAELERQETEEKTQDKKAIFATFKRIIPDFGKIKELFASFSNKQKLYAGIIIFLILFVPFVFLKLQSAMKAKPVPPQAEQKVPDARELFSKEKNIVFLDNLEKLSDLQNPKGLMFLNEKIIAVNDSKLISRDLSGDIKEISWPENYGKIKDSDPMKDLNLGLFYTDQNKVISYLSATAQLKENNISIPANSKISSLATYLTYAYLLDSESSQIYRYPRAEGGFGEKTNWLKDSIDLSSACCMAIDENVYLINSGLVIKLFKGQKQELNLEPTINPFTPEEIFTDSDTQNLYVLDKENGRIIKYGKDGELLGQYLHEDIKKSTGLAVDEKNGKAYLIASEGLFSINLE